MNPILLWVGPFPITSFGLASAMGTLLSYLILTRRARREGMDPEVIVDIYLVMLVLGFLGCRLMYLVSYPEAWANDPWAIFKIWSGGLTFYGGFLGASLGGLAYCWRYRLPLRELFDLFVPMMALGHMFGRIGCFGNGCCFGTPVEYGYGWVFLTDPHRLPRHATQLYEAFGLGVLALVLNRMWIRGQRGGRVGVGYIGGYAVLRFGLEFFRGDTLEESYLFGLTLGQSTAILLVGVAFVLSRSVAPLPRPRLGEMVPEDCRLEPGEDGAPG